MAVRALRLLRRPVSTIEQRGFAPHSERNPFVTLRKITDGLTGLKCATNVSGRRQRTAQRYMAAAAWADAKNATVAYLDLDYLSPGVIYALDGISVKPM